MGGKNKMVQYIYVFFVYLYTSGTCTCVLFISAHLVHDAILYFTTISDPISSRQMSIAPLLVLRRGEYARRRADGGVGACRHRRCES